MRRAARVLLVLLAVEVVVLLVSGVQLWRDYHPVVRSTLGDPVLDARWASVRLARTVHRTSSFVAVPTSLGALVASVAVPGAGRARRAAAIAVALGLVGATVAATATGFALVWDQLAVGQVSVGDSLPRGYRWITGSDVGIRFVLVDGARVGLGAFRRAFWSHVAALPLVLLGLGAWLSWSLRRGGQRRNRRAHQS